MRLRLSTFLALAFAILLLACASHPPKVNCDGKLTPINPPAPVARSDATNHEG